MCRLQSVKRVHNERLFPVASAPHIDDLLDKLRNDKCMTHLDLRSSYNQVRMYDDGPQDDSIAATAFQGLTPNGASCFYWKCWLWDLASVTLPPHSPDL